MNLDEVLGLVAAAILVAVCGLIILTAAVALTLGGVTW